MSNYREVMRRKLLEQMYDKMSDEEKRLFVRLTMENHNAEEIKNALLSQREQLDRIEKNQNWKVDFLSDVGANLFTDSILWIGSKILKRL